jgi:hypothetical protein
MSLADQYSDANNGARAPWLGDSSLDGSGGNSYSAPSASAPQSTYNTIYTPVYTQKTEYYNCWKNNGTYATKINQLTAEYNALNKEATDAEYELNKSKEIMQATIEDYNDNYVFFNNAQQAYEESAKEEKIIEINRNKFRFDSLKIVIPNTVDAIKTIAATYTAPFINSVNLIAWYKLDGNILDSSGNGRTLLEQNGGLTYSNGITNLLPYSTWANSTEQANTNWAITPYLNANIPLTFAFWFRVTGGGSYTILGYGNYATAGIQFDFNNNRLNAYTNFTSGYDWGNSAGAPNLNLNTWYYCTYVITNENVTKTYMYIDGELKGNAQASAIKAFETSLRLAVGNSGDGARGFQGNLSDIRIYNRALTADEVLLLYKASKIVPS